MSAAAGVAAEVPPGTPWVAILSGAPFSIIHLTQESITAGRSGDAELQVQHVEVSRRHCRFYWKDAHLFVEDLGSHWGTKVNGITISAATRVAPGDLIGLGAVVLQFGTGAPPGEVRSESSDALGAAALPVLMNGVNTSSVSLRGKLTLGRDEACDVVLGAPAVSRRHAVVEAGPRGFRVIDQRSRAGSFANGHRFDEHDLVIGDRLRLGPFSFLFDGRALRRISGSVAGSIEAQDLERTAGDVHVLDGISLRIAPGHFVGIIGPSGAGKSSLLDALAGMREPDGGHVFVDDSDLYQSAEKPVLGFVPQEDIVHRELSIVEALRFAARLRLPSETPALELQKLLVQTMDQLGLRDRAGTRIAQLSGGQRKRVSVGVELLARPPVLFLDEPSSGLDPATEFNLMELLRDLTDIGCTIVCTTHVLENAYLMDQLVVLARGRLVFTGSAEETRTYFEVSRLSALYEKLEERGGELAARAREQERPCPPPRERRKRARQPRRRNALPILLTRQAAILRSDWRNFALLAGQPVAIAALVSWVTDDVSLALFFTYLATMWFGCSNAAQEIVRELPIYKRERIIGVGRHAYLTSKFLFLGAITAVQGLLFYAVLQVGEAGLPGTALWQIAAILGAAGAAVGIGCAISALAQTALQAGLFVPLLLIPLILFSGLNPAAHEMKNPVYLVSRTTPTFGAQRLMDLSFLWKQRIARDTLSDHWTSMNNVNRDAKMRTGEVFDRAAPGFWAMLTQSLWMLGGYVVAWFGLRVREC